MVLRTKLAELLEKAAQIPPEALAGPEVEAPPPSPQALLAQAESLRSKITATRAKAEALARAEAEAPPPSPQLLLAQAESLRNRITAARAKAEEIAATERQTELLERALELWSTIAEVRERYEQTVGDAARAELMEQLETLRRECLLTLARVRLVPEVITV